MHAPFLTILGLIWSQVEIRLGRISVRDLLFRRVYTELDSHKRDIGDAFRHGDSSLIVCHARINVTETRIGVVETRLGAIET